MNDDKCVRVCYRHGIARYDSAKSLELYILF